MAKYVNMSGGFLVLADQTEIADGASVEIDADGAGNLAVSRWIEEGKLQKPADAAKTEAADAEAEAAAAKERADTEAATAKASADAEAARQKAEAGAGKASK